MNKKEKLRYSRCMYYHSGLIWDPKGKEKHYCSPGARTIHDICEQKKEIDPSVCETCEKFKSRYIEYPLTIDGIDVKQPEAYGITFTPVKVRPCKEDKTYFGILLGNFPWMTSASFNEEAKKLTISTANNPCILIPERKEIVFGAESWWQRIEPGDDISDITDEDIDNTWYVKLLREMENHE